MKPLIGNGSPLSSPVLGSLHHDVDSASDVADQYDDVSSNGDSPLPHEDDPGSDSSVDFVSKSVSRIWSRLLKPRVAEAPAIVLCFWCKRVCEQKQSPTPDGPRNAFSLSSGDKHFCSEVCFNQCRRASFKKAKVCDWCHQVKPTVSYVDFTDGKHQLQFCSDSCLNQYKMHIFCRETEAHLQLHPHLNDLRGSRDGTLITPELWLKDCYNPEIKTTAEKPKTSDAQNEIESENEHTGPIGKAQSSSGSSTREASPASLFDSSEPVNLSITQSKERRSLLPENNKQEPSFEERRKCLTPRHGRNTARTPQPRDSSNYTSRKILKENIKGRIRVRQLEERRAMTNSDSHYSSSVHTSTSPASVPSTLPNIPGLGLFLGGQPPFLPNFHNILPPAPTDFPHPQILPQLLLSHPDYIKLHGLRPQFVLPHTPLPPQQPPQITPPNPTPITPSTAPRKHTGVPEVTVLLPYPIPLPIPVPIPIPFPVPINEFNAIKRRAENQEDENDITVDVTNSPLSSEEMIDQPQNSSGTSSSPISKPLNERSLSLTKEEKFGLCNLSLRSRIDDMNTTEVPNEFSSTSADPESSTPLTLLREQGPVQNRKERRSILRYTSDVYEVNGVFVPKGGTWLGSLPSPSLPSTNGVKKKDKPSGSSVSSSVSSNGASSNYKTNVRDKASLVGGNIRKRSHDTAKLTNTNHDKKTEAVPKKKHLLV